MKMKKMKFERIILHCSATPPNMNIGVDEITRWHIERGWRTCGYHYVIRRDGTTELGRPVWQKGAHAKGHNDAVGICMVGGVDADGNPEMNFENVQFRAVRDLVANLRAVFGHMVVLGHRDLPGVRKACPSFDVRTRMTSRWCDGENT